MHGPHNYGVAGPLGMLKIKHIYGHVRSNRLFVNTGGAHVMMYRKVWLTVSLWGRGVLSAVMYREVWSA